MNIFFYNITARTGGMLVYLLVRQTFERGVAAGSSLGPVSRKALFSYLYLENEVVIRHETLHEGKLCSYEKYVKTTAMQT